VGADPSFAEYADYLKKRSGLGHIYRRYWLYPRLARMLEGRALDIGCGIGDFVAFRSGTVGVDVNPETVAYCQRIGLDAHVMQPDILPFANADFDAVVLDNVLEHLAHPAPLLAEMARVLRAGGHAIVGVPGRKGYASDPDHKCFYDEPALVDRMAMSDFELVRLMHFPLPIRWLDTYARQYCIYGLFVKR